MNGEMVQSPDIVYPMNRSDRRRLARAGKHRTKPPVTRVKPHLPGVFSCTARLVFLDAATSGRIEAVGPALAVLRMSPAPCPLHEVAE